MRGRMGAGGLCARPDGPLTIDSQTGRVDYALESGGAGIVQECTSASYTMPRLTILSVQLLAYVMPPSTMLRVRRRSWPRRSQRVLLS